MFIDVTAVESKTPTLDLVVMKRLTGGMLSFYLPPYTGKMITPEQIHYLEWPEDNPS